MTIARVPYGDEGELRGVRVACVSVLMPGVRLVGFVEGGLCLKKRDAARLRSSRLLAGLMDKRKRAAFRTTGPELETSGRQRQRTKPGRICPPEPDKRAGTRSASRRGVFAAANREATMQRSLCRNMLGCRMLQSARPTTGRSHARTIGRS